MMRGNVKALRRYISNAFSLSMLQEGGDIEIRRVDAQAWFERERFTTVTSVVGHKDTAELFSAVLGRIIVENRVSITLWKGDEILVGQYVGPRLTEGTRVLPDGATILWFGVTVVDGPERPSMPEEDRSRFAIRAERRLDGMK
jgi:hypothetical protein